MFDFSRLSNLIPILLLLLHVATMVWCPDTYLAAAFPFRGRCPSLLGRFVVA